MKKEQKRQTKKLDGRTIGLLCAMIICASLFIFMKIKTVQIFSLFGMLFIQVYMDYFYKKERADNFSKILTTILFCGYLLIFIPLSVGEIYLSVTFVFLLFLSVMIFILIRLIRNLHPKTRPSIPEIIINYLFIVIVISLIFGLFYALTGSMDGNQILNSENVKITSMQDYLYFSTFTLYSMNNGEIAYGINRVIMLLEIFMSFIIHAIIIVRAVESLKNNQYLSTNN